MSMSTYNCNTSLESDVDALEKYAQKLMRDIPPFFIQNSIEVIY